MYLCICNQIVHYDRYLHREAFEPLWNHQHIDRIEVVMKETVDVKGENYTYKPGLPHNLELSRLRWSKSLSNRCDLGSEWKYKT